MSLKRFLMDQRVPADLRGDLPLVVSGTRVVWVPGQAAFGPGPGPLVRLSVERTS
jgi:hypothetical protein